VGFTDIDVDKAEDIRVPAKHPPVEMRVFHVRVRWVALIANKGAFRSCGQLFINEGTRPLP